MGRQKGKFYSDQTDRPHVCIQKINLRLQTYYELILKLKGF